MSRRNPCTDARRTETTCVTPTCVAPINVDSSRDFFFFFFFFSELAARGGGGGRCQTFSSFSFAFFPCSADHERDWPPSRVVFFGLATNALNVRNNNNICMCPEAQAGSDLYYTVQDHVYIYTT